MIQIHNDTGIKNHAEYIEMVDDGLSKHWNIKHNPNGRQNKIWTILSK